MFTPFNDFCVQICLFFDTTFNMIRNRESAAKLSSKLPKPKEKRELNETKKTANKMKSCENSSPPNAYSEMLVLNTHRPKQKKKKNNPNE